MEIYVVTVARQMNWQYTAHQFMEAFRLRVGVICHLLETDGATEPNENSKKITIRDIRKVGPGEAQLD